MYSIRKRNRKIHHHLALQWKRMILTISHLGSMFASPPLGMMGWAQEPDMGAILVDRSDEHANQVLTFTFQRILLPQLASQHHEL